MCFDRQCLRSSGALNVQQIICCVNFILIIHIIQVHLQITRQCHLEKAEKALSQVISASGVVQSCQCNILPGFVSLLHSQVCYSCRALHQYNCTTFSMQTIFGMSVQFRIMALNKFCVDALHEDSLHQLSYIIKLDFLHCFYVIQKSYQVRS